MPRQKKKSSKCYFVVRGRRARLDHVVLVLPEANGPDVRLIVSPEGIRYEFEDDEVGVVATNYEHENLMPSH